MLSRCSDCCAPSDQQDAHSDRRADGATSVLVNAALHATTESVRSVTLDEKADRSRAVAVSEERERQWVAITAYQPVDTVVKTVEVPVVRTIETYVPKVIVEEKIVEVPKYVPEYVEKIVMVPELKIVDKVVEVPQYQYKLKYVPKIETQENIIHRPTQEIKYAEKVVEVPQIKEVVRYQEVEEVEEVIRYVPKGHLPPEEWERVRARQEEEVRETRERREAEIRAAEEYQARVDREQQAYECRKADVGAAFSGAAPPLPPAPRLEQVYKPKVIKTVEIQKHVPVSVDVPVPYMVPKPVVVPVQVPVLKFRDHFVPVPVRRRVAPRIRWTNEVYQVECIKEKPFLQVQDIIKPVPCDVEIKVHEFVEKAQPINPAELSQADIHAMWMRVNADLAEKRKEELGDRYPYVRHPEGTVFGEPGVRNEEDGSDTADPEARGSVEPLALHPGHPLNMTYLQNEWIKKETTATHEMYTPEWFEAHQKALHNMTMQYPTQVQLSAEQAERIQAQTNLFGEAPWLEGNGEPPKPNANASDGRVHCGVCSSTCCIGDNTCRCAAN